VGPADRDAAEVHDLEAPLRHLAHIVEALEDRPVDDGVSLRR